MTRGLIAIFAVGLIGALSIGPSEAAKAQKKKAGKVEYMRAAGSEPSAPVRPLKKRTKAAE